MHLRLRGTRGRRRPGRTSIRSSRALRSREAPTASSCSRNPRQPPGRAPLGIVEAELVCRLVELDDVGNLGDVVPGYGDDVLWRERPQHACEPAWEALDSSGLPDEQACHLAGTAKRLAEFDVTDPAAALTLAIDELAIEHRQRQVERVHQPDPMLVRISSGTAVSARTRMTTK